VNIGKGYERVDMGGWVVEVLTAVVIINIEVKTKYIP